VRKLPGNYRRDPPGVPKGLQAQGGLRKKLLGSRVQYGAAGVVWCGKVCLVQVRYV
jgi:hypothetical protein